jgi:hypothetical protein
MQGERAMDLHYLELTELADLLRRREVTSIEVTRAQLERIDRLDGALASYARVTPVRWPCSATGLSGIKPARGRVSRFGVTQAIIDWAPACALEAAVAHRKTYPARKDRYGPVLASVLDAGNVVSAFDYQTIQQRRLALHGCFAHLLRTIDA